MSVRPVRQSAARNPWTREMESRACRGCGAQAGSQCVTAAGTGAPQPHAERFNDAEAARGSEQRVAERISGNGLPGPAADDLREIAKEAVDLLCTIGFSGLDRSKQRELWQRGLDLDRRLHPGRARTIVWTPEEGDVDPPRREDGSPLPSLELH